MKSVLKKIIKNIDENFFIRSRLTKRDCNISIQKKSDFLKKNGYVIFDHLVDSPIIDKLVDDLNKAANKFKFRKPLLAQSRVDRNKHKELISNNFLLSRSDLTKYNIEAQFNTGETLADFVGREKPPSLEFEMPDKKDFYDVWLDPVILKTVEMYFGFTPILAEAFIRRNYPSEFVVMNHGWHRDKNHEKHLLKGFIFLNDCNIENGPHHYLEGTHKLEGYSKKTYYSDDEIEELKRINNIKEIISIVPKGTIIIEDTRGLHKAGIPIKGFRDLGFSTFMPNRLIKKRNVDYRISNDTYNKISNDKKRWLNVQL